MRFHRGRFLRFQRLLQCYDLISGKQGNRILHFKKNTHVINPLTLDIYAMIIDYLTVLNGRVATFVFSDMALLKVKAH